MRSTRNGSRRCNVDEHFTAPCRIVLFTGSFPPGAGGSIEYISNIFSALPANCTIIQTGGAAHPDAATFDRNFPQQVERKSFIVNVLDESKSGRISKFFGLFQWVWSAVRLISRVRPDVVHIGEYNYSFLAAILAKMLYGTPYLLYTYAEEITYMTTRPARLRLLRLALRHATALVTVSDYTSGLLIACGADPAKISKVLPAVSDIKRVAPSAELTRAVRSKYLLSGRRVLLTVGRLEERKGHCSVVDAMPAILAVVPDLVYVIVGGGPYDESIREHVSRAGMTQNVIFTGRAPDQDVAALYAICDVFVMAHRQLAQTLDTEGCPTVFLEAGAHGKPVVGGDAGGVADAIIHGETGLIVDGTEPQAIADAVVQLLSDDGLAARMGSAGRAYVDLLRPEKNAAAIQTINHAMVFKDGRGAA